MRSHTPLWSRVQSLIQNREEQVFLVLSLLIGALAGLAVVAFIVLTERLGMRLYPVGSPAWRRVAMPVGGSLAMGYLLYRYFPDPRGSSVPQTKAALHARNGNISLRTVLGNREENPTGREYSFSHSAFRNVIPDIGRLSWT